MINVKRKEMFLVSFDLRNQLVKEQSFLSECVYFLSLSGCKKLKVKNFDKVSLFSSWACDLDADHV